MINPLIFMIKERELNENNAPLAVAVSVVAANDEGRGFEMNEKNRRRS